MRHSFFSARSLGNLCLQCALNKQNTRLTYMLAASRTAIRQSAEFMLRSSVCRLKPAQTRQRLCKTHCDIDTELETLEPKQSFEKTLSALTTVVVVLDTCVHCTRPHAQSTSTRQLHEISNDSKKNVRIPSIGPELYWHPISSEFNYLFIIYYMILYY